MSVAPRLAPTTVRTNKDNRHITKWKCFFPHHLLQAGGRRTHGRYVLDSMTDGHLFWSSLPSSPYAICTQNLEYRVLIEMILRKNDKKSSKRVKIFLCAPRPLYPRLIAQHPRSHFLRSFALPISRIIHDVFGPVEGLAKVSEF